MFRSARYSLVVAFVLSLTAQRTSRAQVTVNQGLAFGTVISGTSTSVAVTAPGAMRFKIHGTLVAATILSFGLPTSLSRTGGGPSMPVSFCSSCAAYRINNTNPIGASTFNPNALLGGVILAVAADVYIWIGGAVNPPLNQPAGSYTGTVSLTLAVLL
jgi:hypothetical protein